MLRIAERSEDGAVVRLLDAAKDLAADADGRFKGSDLCDVEELFGVARGKLFAQVVAADGNGADAAPFAVAYREDFADDAAFGYFGGPPSGLRAGFSAAPGR